jgi:hypothetical protein
VDLPGAVGKESAIDDRHFEKAAALRVVILRVNEQLIVSGRHCYHACDESLYLLTDILLTHHDIRV